MGGDLSLRIEFQNWDLRDPCSFIMWGCSRKVVISESGNGPPSDLQSALPLNFLENTADVFKDQSSSWLLWCPGLGFLVGKGSAPWTLVSKGVRQTTWYCSSFEFTAWLNIPGSPQMARTEVFGMWTYFDLWGGMSFFFKAILGDSKLHVWISYFFLKSIWHMVTYKMAFEKYRRIWSCGVPSSPSVESRRCSICRDPSSEFSRLAGFHVVLSLTFWAWLVALNPILSWKREEWGKVNECLVRLD